MSWPRSTETPQIVEMSAVDRPTFERFYRTVLAPSFPPSELVGYDELSSAYQGEDAEPGALLLVDGEPVAGLLAEQFEASGVLLIGYLAVHDSCRGQGCGGLLVSTLIPRWQAELRPSVIIGEIDDPRFHAGDAATGDPHARLRFWARTGARLVAMPYFQPSLRAGAPRVENMLLFAYTNDDALPGATLREFIREYFTMCEGERSLADPAVRVLLDAARRTDDRVPVWPLDRFLDLPR